MAEYKLEAEHIEKLAEWMNDNKEVLEEAGKQVYILVVDDKTKSKTSCFAGNLETMIALHEDVERLKKECAKDIIHRIISDLEE